MTLYPFYSMQGSGGRLVEPPALLICNLQFMILMSLELVLNIWSRILEILHCGKPV